MDNKRLLILIFLFALTLNIYGQNKFLVEPYVQNVTDTSFCVLFETEKPSGIIAFLAQAKPNTLQPYFEKIPQSCDENRTHIIVYKNLNKEVEYLYRIACVSSPGDTLWGPVTPFRIPDYKKQPIICTVIGDTQKNPDLWRHFAEMMAQERPSFILHVGDMVGYGPYKEHWTEHFFYPAKDLFRYYPLYPVLGNHEMNHSFFYHYFDLPGEEWFYTLKRGNALFVLVDTNRDILPGSVQYRMLEQTLATASEDWKIVLHHHPVYVSSGYYNPYVQPVITGDPEDVHLKSLYETYGVDLVLNGHIHNYERSMPIFQGQINKEKGVTYITTGGGGGNLDKTVLQRTWYLAETKSRHHYLKLNIWENTLQIQAIDSAGLVFDNWEKTKLTQELIPPLITCNQPCFIDKTIVRLENRNLGTRLAWILDGKENTTLNTKVDITLDKTSKLIAYVYAQDGTKSRLVTKIFTCLPLIKPLDNRKIEKIRVEYFDIYCTQLPDFEKLKPQAVFFSDSLTLDVIQPRSENQWAARFRGTFMAPRTDVYRFLLESFDGSRLLIDGKEIIDNDGMHYEILRENYVALEKGIHIFEVHFFDYVNRETLNLWMGTVFEELVNFNTYLK